MNKGITIIELLMASLIGAIFIGMALGMWYFAYRGLTLEQIKTKSRVDLEIGMERIKQEFRLSSLNYVSFYPAGAVEYTALSFPMATPDPNNTDFLTLTADENIDWDESVVYYLYGDKLKRTVFTNNRNYLMDAGQRYSQVSELARAATDPEVSMPAGAPNRNNAATATVIENVSSFIIKPTYQLFDGYSPTTKRSDKVDFGVVRLNPFYDVGYHDFRFEAVDTSGTGYKMGIDTVAIAPSGCEREAEVIALNDSTLLDTHSDDSDDTASTIIASGWSGNQYLEYSSDAAGDYINLRLYYDLYRESNFDNATKDNTLLTGDSLYIKLPDISEGAAEGWESDVQTGGAVTDYNVGAAPQAMAGITVRNLISSGMLSAYLNSNPDLVRVEFTANSASTYDLRIAEAYIAERDTGQNAQPAGPTTRIKLYFTDGSGNITEGTTVSAGSSEYSNWAVFPIDISKDYFVTLHIDGAGPYVSYSPGLAGVTHSYLRDYDTVPANPAADDVWPEVPADMTGAGVNPPAELPVAPPGGTACTMTRNIYAATTLEAYEKDGWVLSDIHDTQLANPDYNDIGWTEVVPAELAAADVKVYAGSSDDPAMTGATWDSPSSTNPHPLSIGSGRYVQFQADLSTTPYWTCINPAHSAVASVSDADYKAGTIQCPTCFKYLIPTVACPAVDNVTIDWPGETTPCRVTAYFTQKPDYGIIKLTVDGEDFTKGVDLSINISDTFQSKTYDTSVTTGAEPRNTGR